MEGGLKTKELGVWTVDAGKRKEMDSPLESPEGMQPCGNLDFSLIRLISDF